MLSAALLFVACGEEPTRRPPPQSLDGGSHSAVDGDITDGGAKDASSSERDAGGLLDSGEPFDAGVDAGHRADAGFRPDAGNQDLGSAPDLGGGGNGPCPSYAGLQPGRRWQTRSTAAFEAQHMYRVSSDSKVVSISSQGSYTQVMLEVSQTTSGATFNSRTTGIYEYRCDAEGYSLVKLDSRSETTQSGMSYVSTQITTYSPPYLILPPNPQPGDTWRRTQTVSSRGVGPTGEPFNNSQQISQSATVNGFQMVTVPTGQYRTLHITTQHANSSSEAYWADGIGMVQSNVVQLIGLQ